MPKINIKVIPEAGGILSSKNNPWMLMEDIPQNTKVDVIVFPTNGHIFDHWRGELTEDNTCSIPLTLIMGDHDLNIEAVFIPCPDPKPDLSVHSDFDNGNAIVRYIDNKGRLILLESRQVNDCCNIWWHFIVDGIHPDETITLDIYHSNIAGDCQPVYSYDGENWERFSAQHPPFIQKFKSSRVEIARNIPYSWTQSVNCIQKYVSECPDICRDHILCLSEKGREVHQLQVTDRSVPSDGKKIIWVQARTHAFESHSSWVAEGFIKWVCGSSDEAKKIRHDNLIFVTPVIDVDNVYSGGAGKSQWIDGYPADHNRDWGGDPIFNTTKAIMNMLEDLAETNEISAFVDLHDPWYYQGPEFYINNMDLENGRRFFVIFSEMLKETCAHNTWNHCNFVTGQMEQSEEQEIGYFGGKYHPVPIFRYDLIEPQRYVSSATWMKNSGLLKNNDALNILLEIPHWKDDTGNCITKDGLLDYGSCLGASILRYSEKNE